MIGNRAHEPNRKRHRATAVDGGISEPCYRPVLERSTGLVVGAELLPAPGPAGAAAGSGSVPVLTRRAAHAFAFGPAADEGWWIAAGLRPGQAAAPSAAEAVQGLLRDSGLTPDRLVLTVSHAELTRAVGSGAAAALGDLGVRFSVVGFGALDWSVAALRAAPVADLQVSLAGLRRSDPHDVALVRSLVALAGSCGTRVAGRDVESAEQLELAGEAGVELVEGYWWGSPGSLEKLAATWARLPVNG